jgi:toxin ParE1/3/4
MAEINWTFEAERWLKEIYDHIAQDNPTAATKVVNAIYDKVDLLRMFPQLGYKYDPQAHKEIRILLYGHYRIAYLLKPDQNIDILGIFHSALDITRYL